MNKVTALFNLFRRGEEVANAAGWKNKANVANLLLAIVAAAAAFGYRFDIDNATLDAIAVLVVAVGNGVVHIIADHRVGLGVGVRPGAEAVPEAGDKVDQPGGPVDPGGA